MTAMRVAGVLLLAGLLIGGCGREGGSSAGAADGGGGAEAVRGSSPDFPLRVMLIPADGGTSDGTLADFQPIFNAISKTHGLHFDLKVGQSYAAVVQGMAGGKVDVAFLGPVSYHQARELGAAELLAVSVTDGESTYLSGVFVRRGAGIGSLAELRGRSVAFGDINSASSFAFPAAMMIEAGLDPARDLGSVLLAGSHANALAALGAGQVDAACASLASFEKAVNNGVIDPEEVVPLAVSDPIPNPPLAMHVGLPEATRETLTKAFNTVHTMGGVGPGMIRGYGGKRVDRYDADFPEAEFDAAMVRLGRVTDDLKAAMLDRASRR